jgi:hypothetical protein
MTTDPPTDPADPERTTSMTASIHPHDRPGTLTIRSVPSRTTHGTDRPHHARPAVAARLTLLIAAILLAGAGAAAAGAAAVGDDAAPAPGIGEKPVPGAGEPLTLRISDAVAHPGGVAAVVIRTYSSRPVGQGQLDFFATPRASALSLGRSRRGIAGGAGPLAPYLIGHVVFSGNGDVQSMVETPRDAPDRLRLLFVSPSGSVNDLDGPLAALFFRLPAGMAPGTVFDLALDGGSLLVDEAGEPVPIDIEPGVLTVRAYGDPRLVAADGDRIEPGETAEIGVETLEPFALTAGHVVLRYDPTIASGPPAIRFDGRYGRAAFTADVSTPGTIVVDFEAPYGSLNRDVPGEFIQISLPISSSVPPGTRSPFEIDPETWLEPLGFNGDLPLVFKDDEIEIE